MTKVRVWGEKEKQRYKIWYEKNKEKKKAYSRERNKLGITKELLRESRKKFRKIETYIIRINNKIVYVGRTDFFRYRMNRHEKDQSPWLAEPHTIEHRYHNTFGDSLVDEAILIRDHQPKYNTIGVTK